MTRDERLAWLTAAVEADETPAAPDAVLAAALRVGETFGWYYDPVLGPDTVLELVELVATALDEA